jgi:hypothetical protein
MFLHVKMIVILRTNTIKKRMEKPSPFKNKNTEETYQSAAIKVSHIMPTECVKTATTQKVEQRKPLNVNIQTESYMLKVSAKTVISLSTIRTKEIQKKILSQTKAQRKC